MTSQVFMTRDVYQVSVCLLCVPQVIEDNKALLKQKYDAAKVRSGEGDASLKILGQFVHA